MSEPAVFQALKSGPTARMIWHLCLTAEWEYMDKNAEAIIQLSAALIAVHVVVVETLHKQGVLDKGHFSQAFGEAIAGLAPDLKRQPILISTLRNLQQPFAEKSDFDFGPGSKLIH